MSLWETRRLYLCARWHFGGCNPPAPFPRSPPRPPPPSRRWDGPVQHFIWQAHRRTAKREDLMLNLCDSVSGDWEWFHIVFDILIFKADILWFSGHWSCSFISFFFGGGAGDGLFFPFFFFRTRSNTRELSDVDLRLKNWKSSIVQSGRLPIITSGKNHRLLPFTEAPHQKTLPFTSPVLNYVSLCSWCCSQ